MNPPSPRQTNELLQRILNALQPAKPRQGFEIACAIILALATTASACCAYPSKLWGGAQIAQAMLLFLGTLAGLTTLPICDE